MLDLGVGPRGREVAVQGFGCAPGGQWDVPTSFRIANGEPSGVEGQDPAERLEHLPGPQVQPLRPRADLGQLLLQAQEIRFALLHWASPPASCGTDGT